MKYYKLLAVFTIMHFTVLAQNESAILIESWKDETWQNKYKTTFEYDIEGNEITVLGFQWDNYTLEWKNDRRTEATYDTLSRKLETVIKRWDANSNSWIFWEFEYMEYEGMLSMEYKRKWNGYDWVNVRRILRVVDSSINLVDETWQDWNSDNEEWRSTSRTSNTWNKNRRKKEARVYKIDTQKKDEWTCVLKTTFDETAEKDDVVLKTERFKNGEWTEFSPSNITVNEENSYYPDGRLFQQVHRWIGAKGNLEIERTTRRY